MHTTIRRTVYTVGEARVSLPFIPSLADQHPEVTDATPAPPPPPKKRRGRFKWERSSPTKARQRWDALAASVRKRMGATG